MRRTISKPPRWAHPEQLQSKLELTPGIQRRRKQLRVAQQAYRKRKETTIVNLQSRVQELESGIEELSESFLSFSNLLFKAGILQNQPRVTAALQKITQQCVSLAKRGCDEAEQPAAPADVSPSTSPTLSDTQDVISNYKPLDSLPIIGDAFQSSWDLAAQWPGLSQLTPTQPFQEQAILPFGIALSSPNIPFSSIPSPALNFPTIVSPDNLLKQGRWTLSHLLVRQCCETGYYLLTSLSGDDPRVKAIFGKRLAIDERNCLISGFVAVMHDEIGDTIESRTKVLNSRRNSYSPERLAVSSRTWQIVNESGADEWMDASGVQRLLQQRGIRIQDPSSPLSSPRFNSAPQLNAASFIKYLSLCPICLGRGPAFRKRDVENAIRLATLDDPWAFNPVCEIP
ncbi:bZIP transcription factor [Metarhizium robertsii]|uniref:BZIP transcription factor, bZIP-1 n=2 Tax=Metarhizium robertsii TaxID=568076 RepID=E9EJS9_METRA|nr:bZIP transcription factor, bZIP-1 [Metarhizium robertsii ARSEF 23]EFZ03814.1 bZIP transcription factor, bZIP-1 [Metarhizium robertsii ARSEF 23]EXU99314.1 bZIP transcription factor [Metarhizium robertsii]